VSTLCVEASDEAYMLVHYPTTTSNPHVLGYFISEEAADEFKEEAYDRSLLMAREVGRAGLG
jgi:hypothetical protein